MKLKHLILSILSIASIIYLLYKLHCFDIFLSKTEIQSIPKSIVDINPDININKEVLGTVGSVEEVSIVITEASTPIIDNNINNINTESTPSSINEDEDEEVSEEEEEDDDIVSWYEWGRVMCPDDPYRWGYSYERIKKEYNKRHYKIKYRCFRRGLGF